MKPNCPNGFSFEKISTFISLPIIQDSGDYMAADIACINFGYQYEYEKFIGILLFMPIITAVLDNW